MSTVVIVGANRTALGALLGQFTGVPATQLGATAIQAALAQSGVAPESVSEVIMGCVLPAGLGQAPARQAALGAGLPVATGATTINKVCGSGMKAIMLGHDLIRAGSADVVVAGGMESMTNAPHLLIGSRTGIKFGSTEMLDHMAWDGLTNPYDKQPMGPSANCAPTSTPSPATNRTRSPPSPCAARWPRSRRRLQGRDRAGDRQRPQGRRAGGHRRAAGQVRHRQDPQPAPGLQEGRHHHRRQFVEHQRRRRGRGAGVGGRGQGAGPGPAGAPSLPTPPTPQAPEWFTTAPVAAIRKPCWPRPAGQWPTWTCSRSTRPLPVVAMAPIRNWASTARQLNVQRRRLRAGPSDRRQPAPAWWSP